MSPGLPGPRARVCPSVDPQRGLERHESTVSVVTPGGDLPGVTSRKWSRSITSSDRVTIDPNRRGAPRRRPGPASRRAQRAAGPSGPRPEAGWTGRPRPWTARGSPRPRHPCELACSGNGSPGRGPVVVGWGAPRGVALDAPFGAPEDRSHDHFGRALDMTDPNGGGCGALRIGASCGVRRSGGGCGPCPVRRMDRPRPCGSTRGARPSSRSSAPRSRMPATWVATASAMSWWTPSGMARRESTGAA